MFRPLRKLLLVLGTLFVLLLTGLALIGHFYEDEVKARLLGALNAHLNGPVEVGQIELTLIRRFPQASLHLHDVLAREALPDQVFPDTLLHAEDLYLEFGLLDLFRGDYVVREVHGSHVRLHAARDAEGRPNWLLWRSDTTGSSGGLDLARVSMQDLTVRYRDAGNALEVLTHSDELALRGRFTDALNELALEGDLHLTHWTGADGPVLTDRDARVRLQLAFGGEDGAFRITEGEVLSGGVPLALTLDVLPEGEADRLDLRANGLGLDLGRVVALLPDAVRKPLASYGMDGEADLALHYHGLVQGEGPMLSVGMQVREGRMKERSTGITFDHIGGDISFDLPPSGKLERLVVKGLSARSTGGSVQGDLELAGLKNAPLTLALKSDIGLADLLRFARVDTLEQVEGRLLTDIRVKGRLRDASAIRVADLKALTIGGTVAFRSASLKLKGVRHRVTGLDADLRLNGNDANVTGLRAELGGNTLELEGDLKGLVPYLLFQDQQLTIVAHGRSPRIDLATLLQEGEAQHGTTGAYALTFPRSLALDLQAEVEELVMEEFLATDVHGRVQLRDRVLTAKPVTFNTASGAVLASLTLDTRSPNSYPLAIDASIEGIAMEQLFAEFQEFGQDFITSRHLRGVTRAQVDLDAPLTPDLTLDLDRLTCTLDLRIDNGHLTGHQPLIDVAEHLQRNKLVSPFVDTDQLRRELADVSFASLENRIEIRDRKVIIPAMTVHSSVMDINLSGEHGFDDRIDHHLDFRLADLFRKGKADDDFGPVVDDGTGMRIFLHMYGTAADPQFANDGAMAAARRKAQFDQEKQELKSILKNELGLFTPKDRKDDLPGNEEGPTTPTIQVDWGDADSTDLATPERPRKKKGLFRLFEEEGAPQETIQVLD